LNGGDNVEP